MERKEILLFLLGEARNEFANSLEDLEPQHLTARPVEDQNPIGWIVCHCMRNAERFLHRVHTGERLLAGDDRLLAYDRYAESPPGTENTPPDLSRAITDLDAIYAAGIETVRSLSEGALDRPGPHWARPEPESAAENCVRVINHSAAHVREVWLLRWAMGLRDHWPHQTLHKRPEAEGGGFYVPDRAAILARRQGR